MKTTIYNINDTVEHETFGIGTVQNKYRNKNNNLVVEVWFNSLSESKTILCKFQGMKKIKGE